MNKLLAGGWVLFAVDLVILGLMVRELYGADLADADRDYAVAVTWGFAVWLCAVNLVLVVSWWRGSRTGLWIAVIAGALPVLWAWTAAVSMITEWATAPQ